MGLWGSGVSWDDGDDGNDDAIVTEISEDWPLNSLVRDRPMVTQLLGKPHSL